MKDMKIHSSVLLLVFSTMVFVSLCPDTQGASRRVVGAVQPHAFDNDPPLVALSVMLLPTVPPTGAVFGVTVTAEDASPVSRVSVSVEGQVVATRIREPWQFRLSLNPPVDPPYPFEICAQAEDLFGNAATACKLIGNCQTSADCADQPRYCHKPLGQCDGPGGCAVRPDIGCSEIDPVCGCDGRTYRCAAEAAVAGVSVASPGACE